VELVSIVWLFPLFLLWPLFLLHPLSGSSPFPKHRSCHEKWCQLSFRQLPVWFYWFLLCPCFSPRSGNNRYPRTWLISFSHSSRFRLTDSVHCNRRQESLNSSLFCDKSLINCLKKEKINPCGWIRWFRQAFPCILSHPSLRQNTPLPF